MKKILLVIFSMIIIFILLFTLICIWQRDNDFPRFSKDKSILHVKISMGNINHLYLFKNPKNIETFLALEKYFEHYQNIMNSQKNTVEVRYGYGLNYEKSYHNIPYDLFNELLNTTEALKQKQYMLTDDIDNVSKITLKSHIIEEKSIIIEDSNLINQIISFLKEYYNSPNFNNNSINYRLIHVCISIEDSISSFVIYSDYKKFFEFLKENNLYNDLLILPEHIESIEVIKGDCSKKITDKYLIEEILEKAYDGYNNNSEYYLKCKIDSTINSNHNILYCSFSKDTVPFNVKYLFD